MEDDILDPVQRRRSGEDARFDWIEVDGGVKLRTAIWNARGAIARGTVVLLHGRREFIEKYFETVGELRDRGFAVATMDWRGQGLSARPLSDRHKGHADDFAHYIGDLDRFVSTVVQRMPRPYFAVAHSFGGHCALRHLHDHPGIFQRAVLIAPMVGVNFAPLTPLWAGRISRLALALRWGGRYAPGQGAYSERNRAREADLLSSDAGRLADEIEACRTNPDLALGGVTYGWVAAALSSMTAIQAPGFAEAIATPSLFVLAGDERVVDNEAARGFAQRMPDARIEEIPGARHEILKEQDQYRARFWAAFDSFLKISDR